MALVVIDEILATAWQASILRAIRDVATEVLTGLFVVLQLITAIALARVILEVVASWAFEVYAHPMRHTGVAFTIVHVGAAVMWRERAVCPALNRVFGEAREGAIQRIPWLAHEVGPVLELVIVHSGPSSVAELGWCRYAA
jgi:hypothetical protein